MARMVSRNNTELEGRTIYFLRLKYAEINGGGETVEGPYLNKPKIQKWWAERGIESSVEEFILQKKEKI